MTTSPIATLLMRIEEYKRKYYLNGLIKGSIFSAAVILSAFLVFNTLEYFGHFGTTFRTILFFSFLGAFLASLIFWVVKPLMFLYGEQKPLSNELAADQIGKYFPEVGDKLVNTLQLTKTLDNSQNELLLASIKQKSQQLGYLKFTIRSVLFEKKAGYNIKINTIAPAGSAANLRYLRLSLILMASANFK